VVYLVKCPGIFKGKETICNRHYILFWMQSKILFNHDIARRVSLGDKWWVVHLFKWGQCPKQRNFPGLVFHWYDAALVTEGLVDCWAGTGLNGARSNMKCHRNGSLSWIRCLPVRTLLNSKPVYGENVVIYW